MKFDRIIKCRATADDEARLDELTKKTGLTTSQVLRQLIANAEVQPTSTFKPIARLTNSDAGSLVLADPAGISR